MDRGTLKKVQAELLDIALEVRRVCTENDIPYFLCAGSMLGAVRHQGFIPWDDDLDLGMLRENYEKFCRIAPQKLGPDYCFQDWHTDPDYPLPFGKVRKRNTLYLEGKLARLLENGFYVDIFPYDVLPQDQEARQRLRRQLLHIYRIKLMKSRARPWMENGSLLLKKRLGYLYYQALALFTSQEALIRRYDRTLAQAAEAGEYRMGDLCDVSDCHRGKILQSLSEYAFEGHPFTGPADADTYLSTLYGDYMTPPPEDQRENRHQIVEIQFSK